MSDWVIELLYDDRYRGAARCCACCASASPSTRVLVLRDVPLRPGANHVRLSPQRVRVHGAGPGDSHRSPPGRPGRPAGAPSWRVSRHFPRCGRQPEKPVCCGSGASSFPSCTACWATRSVTCSCFSCRRSLALPGGRDVAASRACAWCARRQGPEPPRRHSFDLGSTTEHAAR